MPRSPVTRPLAHFPYLTTHGSLTPYWSSSAVTWASDTLLPCARNRESSAVRADPGASSMMKNAISDTATSVTTA